MRLEPALLGLLLAAPASPAGPRPVARSAAASLADELRRLYPGPGSPGERWGRRPPQVELPDGTRVSREVAYRDRPDFVAAAAHLLNGPGDDPLLGVWLLGTASPDHAEEASAALRGALARPDPRVRFEAARQLGRLRDPAARDALRTLVGGGDPAVRGAATWALGRLGAETSWTAAGEVALAEGFCRGVNWWQEEDRGDAGEASFRALAELGVDWVSIHTWDPLQRGVHSPEWAEPRRPFAIPNLEAIVRNAHAAGLRVMVKPHLEMRGYEPTEDERRILRGPDEAARQKLFARLRGERESRPRAWHNDIEMKTEADWRAWFERYEGYLLAYVAQAAEAGADAFCVGRETDKAAIQREADWRRLIARVRERFKGPLTYSANFDGYDRIRFWDALDVIGISAYFPLAGHDRPDDAELRAGWERVMGPLEAFSRRVNRRVVFTEIGYPAFGSAARRPWEEGEGPADVWLQSRLYEAALREVARRPFLVGSFFWLWEGTSRPPFRDASFSIQDKPASFVMARWYAPRPVRSAAAAGPR